VVISIDAFYFGERRMLLDADLGAVGPNRYSVDDVTRSIKSVAARKARWSKASPGRLDVAGIVFWTISALWIIW